MKFLFDENFPKICADHLVALNHEVIDIRGSEKEGLDDNSLFEYAQENSAILLTTDKDFFHTIPYLFEKHNGVIVIAISQPNGKNILDKLKWALLKFSPSEISGKVILLSDKSYSIK